MLCKPNLQGPFLVTHLNEYNPFLTKTTELRLPLFGYVDFIMKLTIILFGDGN